MMTTPHSNLLPSKAVVSNRLLIFCLAAVVAAAMHADGGDLDTTFGTGGKVGTSFGTSANDFVRGLAIQPDGKIIAAGTTEGFDADFALARYLPNGSLDTSFDVDGKVITDFGASDDNYAAAVLLQSDGKIIVVGITDNGTDYDFCLARYDDTGGLDATFGTGGLVITDFGGSEEIFAAALLDDGKIIVVGQFGDADFAVARYLANGTLDTTFGTGDADGVDGITVTDFSGGEDFAFGVAIQSDGKIVVAGRAHGSDDDFGLARYLPGGAIDPSFDTDGKITTDFGGDDFISGVALQSDDRIVVVGETSTGGFDFALARYLPGGGLDTDFDTDGKVTTDFGGAARASSVALQADGKILAAGEFSTMSGNDFAIARYLTDGSLDGDFSGDGKVETDFDGGSDTVPSIAIQGDGKILIGGGGGSAPDDFALIRYTSTPSDPVVRPVYTAIDASARAALEKKIKKLKKNMKNAKRKGQAAKAKKFKKQIKKLTKQLRTL